MKKRILSVLLALTLVLGLLPVSVLAADTAAGPEETETAETPEAGEEEPPEAEEPESPGEEDGSPEKEETGTPEEEPESPGEEISVPKEEAGSPEKEETGSLKESWGPVGPEEIVEGEIITFDDEDFFTNDELLEMYLAGQGESYGLSPWSMPTLSENNQEIYDVLKGQIQALVKGERTSTEFDVKALKIPYDPNDPNASKRVGNDLKTVVACLVMECPAYFYWWGRGTGWSYGSGYLTKVRLSVAIDYYADGSVTEDGRSYTIDSAKVTAANTAIGNAQTIVDRYAGKSTYEILDGYRKEICDLVSYHDTAMGSGSASIGINPWQLVWVFDGDPTTEVVCEGYSKAFQYLCNLTDWGDDTVECYTVTGLMGGNADNIAGAGGHMWNIVRIDGKSYLVDITNCDEGTVGAPRKLFMVGADAGGTARTSYTCSGVTYRYYGSDGTLDKLTTNTDQFTVFTGEDEKILTLVIGERYTDENAPAAIELTYTPTRDGYSDSRQCPYFVMPEISNLGDTKSREIIVTAAIKDENGNEVADKTVDWTVNGTTDGMSVQTNGNTVTLTVNNSAVAAYNPSADFYNGPNVIVTAVCSSTEKAQKFAFYVDHRTATFIQLVDTDGTAVANNTLPAGSTAAVKVYDQYGLDVTKYYTPTWSVTPSDKGVTVNDNGTVTVAEDAAAGSYTVTATVDGTSKTITVKVNAVTKLPADKVTLAQASATYNGAAQKPAVSVEGLTEGTDYEVSYFRDGVITDDFTNVGTITVTVTGIVNSEGGGYAGTVTKTFTIDPATPIIAWGVTPQVLAYTGQQAGITAPTVTLKGSDSFSGTINYSYAEGSGSYTAGLPTNAGTYSVKAGIAASGNYTAAVSEELMLTIEKSQPALEFNSSYNPDRAYNGTAAANPAEADLTITGAKFGDVKFAWTQDGKAVTPVNAGTYTLTASIAETDNTAAVSETKTVTISKASVTVTPDSGQKKEYGAADPVLTYKITPSLFGNDKLTGALTYDGKGGTETAGEYEITKGTLSAGDNYTLTVDSGVKFTITKPSLETAAVTLSPSSYTYDGTAKEPAVTVKKNGAAVGTDEYDIAYSNSNGGDGNHTNAGTVTVTVTAKTGGNYSGSRSTTFTIARKELTPSITGTVTKTYDGTAKAQDGLAIELAGIVGGDVVTATAGFAYDSPNAGTRTITASGITLGGAAAGNYVLSNASATIEGSITKSVPTIAFAGGYNPGKTYDGQTIANPKAENLEITGAAYGNVTFKWSATPKNVGTYTLTATIPETANTAKAEAALEVTITPKQVASPTIELSKDSFEYDGTEKKPTVTIKDGATVIPAGEYTVTYDSNIGVGTATITITNVEGNYIVSGSKSFEITAKPLTGAKVSASGTFTYSGDAHTPEPTVTLGGVTLVKDTDYTVSYSGNVDAGTATVTITGKGNYSGTATGTFAIGKAALTAEGTGVAGGTYGAKLSGLTVAGLTAKLGDKEITGSWKLIGDTVPNVGDSGEYTATFAPASGAGNYNELTAKVKLDIAPAEYTGMKAASTSAKYGAAGNYDLSALLPDGAVAGIPTAGSGIFEGTPSVSGKALSYALKADAAAGNTGTITVPVTSTNYESFSLTITVKVTDKDVPALTVNPITVTYSGTAVPDSAIRGTAKVGDTAVSGTWAFAPGQGLTNAADSGVKTVTFTPADPENYAEATATVSVTIAKAEVRLALTASPSSLTSGGAVTLTLSGLPDGGTAAVTCSDEGITVAQGAAANTWTATLPSGTASYTFTAAYAGDANHAAATAACSVRVGTSSGGNTSGGSSGGGGGGYVPSGSSGTGTSALPVSTTGQNSSYLPTTTTAVPAASTSGSTATVSVSTTMGDEIVQQAVANHSRSVVIAPSVTGSVTRTEVSIPASTVGQIGNQTNASLTVSTPVAGVTIPNGGLASLSSAGGTVTVTAEQMGGTVALSVTAGGRTMERIPGGVTLTVPVSYTTPGTVAMLVNADGTREVVRKSVAENGSITIPLEGSAKLEIVDNSKYFADVPSTSWAADAVAFASSHELFNGTSATQFSPNQAMSRGMLATVLHNLESNPAQALAGVFADVSNSAWYAQGVAWAASNGIVGGYGNGRFGPNDNITREQLAVMLWRYAGSPAATNRELYFTDAYRASSWALNALRWATENGIINGKGNGLLDPGGYATRAETAQMLKNFLERL